MLEIIPVGAQHRKTLVRVAQRNGNGPAHQWVFADPVVGLPADFVGGIAQAEYRIQHQLQRTGSRTNDQIRTGNGTGEAVVNGLLSALHGQQQAGGQGDGQQCQPEIGAPVACTAKGQAHQRQQAVQKK